MEGITQKSQMIYSYISGVHKHQIQYHVITIILMSTITEWEGGNYIF